MMYETLKMITG